MKEIKLHPAGGICDNLVYEPLGNFRYAWTIHHAKKIKRGISTAEIIKDEKSKKTTYLIDIDGTSYEFAGRPLKKIVFKVPDDNFLESWVKGEINSKTAPEVIDHAKKALEVILDLPSDFEHDILVLFVAESWLRHILDVVFHIRVEAAYGGAKTTLQECLATLCYHGYLSGDPSGSFAARIAEQQNLTLLTDELDCSSTSADNLLIKVYRMAYRRGATVGRVKKDTLEPEMIDPFGPKGMSFYGTIERALLTRALPIESFESSDYKLPVINVHKEKLLTPVFNDFWAWYMDNISAISKTVRNRIDVVEDSNVIKWDISIKDKRNFLYDEFTKVLTPEQKKFIQKFRGRNAELAYIANDVANIFGFNCLKSLEKLFKIKQEDELEFGETTHIMATKEALIAAYNIAQVGDKPEDKVPVSEAYNRYVDIMKQDRITPVSPTKFGNYLREFGFVKNINWKPIRKEEKVQRMLIFTPNVRRKLGI